MSFEVRHDNRFGGYVVKATNPNELRMLKNVSKYFEKSKDTPCPLEDRNIEMYGDTLYVCGQHEEDAVFNYLALNEI